MRIFLTGATGYIGGAVAEALQAAGHVVAGLARSSEAEARLRELDIEPVPADLAEPRSLVEAIRSADGVIHTGTTNNGPQDIAAVSAMLDALRHSGKPFVYTSGVWVLGNTGDRVADETAPLNPAALVAWRPSVEQAVLKSEGVRSVVIRPAIVYGEAGGILAGLVQSAKESGKVRFVGNGTNRWPFVHVEDLADLYLRAVMHAGAGTLLHAADGPSITVQEVADAASFAAGAAGETEPWRLEEARQALGPYADALVLDQQVSGQRAKDLLEWNPQGLPVLEDLRYGSYAQPAVSP